MTLAQKLERERLHRLRMRTLNAIRLRFFDYEDAGKREKVERITGKLELRLGLRQ
jgi:hypothetical protein